MIGYRLMPDEIRINRPQPSSPRPENQQPAEREAYREGRDGGSKTPWVILIVVVLLLLVFGALFRDKLFGSKNGTTGGSATTTMKSSGYQAVFLTNGQVYFGKLSDADSNYPVLTDIFYLQVTNPPPPIQGAGAQQNQPTQQTQQPTISLVKLGNELHGPVDEMHISRAQILFYEDLKSDGSVVKAITDYKNNPQNQGK